MFCVVGPHAAWQNTEYVACRSLHQMYFALSCMTCPQVILVVYLCFYADCRQTCKLSYKPYIRCPEVQLLKSKRLQFARSCNHFADVTCSDTSHCRICERIATIAFINEHPDEVELQTGFIPICTMQHMVFISVFALLLVLASVNVTELHFDNTANA